MITNIRKLNEMIEMFEIPSDLYTMHRNVKQEGDLRYDLTSIPSLIFNGHLNKTKGHIHSSGHKELYTVIVGSALFLMQKGNDNITEVVAVMAKEGESVIIPGDCYHITVNIGKKTLQVGNWVSNNCVSDYQFIEKMKGMCYYLKSSGMADKNFVKNKNYSTVPEIRYEPPIRGIPKDLSFLL